MCRWMEAAEEGSEREQRVQTAGFETSEKRHTRDTKLLSNVFTCFSCFILLFMF